MEFAYSKKRLFFPKCPFEESLLCYRRNVPKLRVLMSRLCDRRKKSFRLLLVKGELFRLNVNAF